MEHKIVELNDADWDLVCGGSANTNAYVDPTWNDPPGTDITVTVDVNALNQGTSRLPALVPA